MKICQEVTNKEVWKNFLLNCGEKTFLQSWNWGEFQKRMGNKIWRFAIYNNSGEPSSVALVVKVAAKRGTFLLVPHGFEISETLLNKLKDVAKEENCSFIRISPVLERKPENIEIFKKLGFRQAPLHTHPEASWKLDIRPSEEELLMRLRKTTRYLVRQALKNKEIEIFQSQNTEDIKIFDKLYQEVVKLQHFVPFSPDYLKNEFLAFRPDNQISLFFGKYRGEIVASAFVLFWSGVGFYHHAALDPKYHKLPIAYLLQWEAIKEAKRRGCRLYDFWGYVDPKKHPQHPWAGPTLFKMGFGGRVYKYVKTQDFPLSKKYWFTYLFERLRKVKRNL